VSGKPTTFAPIIGSGAGDAVAGDDSRLTDARTPSAHNQAASTITAATFPAGAFSFTDTQTLPYKMSEVVPTFTTGAVTLTAAECSNTIVSNYSQAAESTITLPAAASGLAFVVTVVTTGVGALHIKAGASDKHYFDGVALDDADKISCATPAIGNMISVLAFKSGAATYDWIATSITGTWTDGGA
jgi:hypothetical protein